MAKPEKRFDKSPCSVSMWENQSKHKGGKPYWTVALQRSYRDEQGDWQHDSEFSLDDVSKVRLLMEKAFEHAADIETENLQEVRAEKAK